MTTCRICNLVPALLVVHLASAAELPFIEVDPQSTTAMRERGTGKPFVAVGVNYFGPHVGWAPKLWQQFDDNTVRRHLTLIHEQGFNAIRVFLTLDAFHREAGKVHPDGEQKLRRLLAIGRDLGIHIVPSGPDHWEGVPPWRAGKDRFADDAILQADEAWWKAFTARFKDEPGILAWDIFNEPAVGWDSPAMKMKWNDWLRREYGSIEKLATAWKRPSAEIGELGSIAVPPAQPALNDPRLFDYQRFRESIGDAWTQRMASAIRSSDTNHLVTIGHIQWVSALYIPTVWHYAGFDLKANARHLDFMTIHFYPLAPPWPAQGQAGIDANALYLEGLLHACTAGKPVMIGEFAWYGGGEIRANDKVVMPRQSLDDQVAWSRKLLDVSRGRVCGWLHWAFADTPTSQDLTRWSGLWTEDLHLKPWGKLFGEFAREATTQPAPPHRFPDYLTAFKFDRRAMLTDPQTGNAYRSTLAGKAR